MKRILVVFFLAFLITGLKAQKLDGVYVGGMLAPVEVFVIKSNGTEVTGSMYSSKTDGLDFFGNYTNQVLKGSIRLANGSKVFVTGRLERNPLRLALSQDSSNDKGPMKKFYKISTSSKHKIADLFSDDNDLLLLGRWKIETATSNNGELLDGVFYWEFDGAGTCRARIIKLSSKTKVPASLPAGFDPYKVIEERWITSGGKLTISLPMQLRTITTDYMYFVKGDTLFTHSTNGNGTMIFIRN